jgi:hypothetical protein
MDTNNNPRRDDGNDRSGQTPVKSLRRDVWVKPSLERLSLRDALTGNLTSHADGNPMSPSS